MSVERNRVVLVITSGRLSGAELIAKVGLPPDRQWTRGETRSADARHGLHELSGIEYHSRVARSSSPDEHLSDLGERLWGSLQTLES